ncbi:MAG TPA: tetratricopeptide repeat protein, partial [Chloroflexaceae bacterium]|nr:tetratricopeptide repeat protein [Chloroflexaceae bacterium]
IRLDPAYRRAYTNRVALLEQRGDLTALAADYAALARLDPERAAAYSYQEGAALAGLRDRAGARRAFDEALRRDPQHVDALYERALLALAEGRPAAAVADLDAALRLSPRAANAFHARGLAHSAAGDHDRARADFTWALELAPDDPAALLGRAAAARALGDDAAARADLDRALALPLDDPLRQAAEALRRRLGGG